MTSCSRYEMSDGHLLPALDACVVICLCIDEVKIVEIAIDQMRSGAHHLEKPFSVTARWTLKRQNKVPSIDRISLHVSFTSLKPPDCQVI